MGKSNIDVVKKKIEKKVEKLSSEKSSQIKIKKVFDENTQSQSEIESRKNLPIDMDRLEMELKERKKIPKEQLWKIILSSFKYIGYAFAICVVAVLMNFFAYNVAEIGFLKNLHIVSFLFLGATIYFFESAYKSEKKLVILSGIEMLVFGFYNLIRAPFNYYYSLPNFSKSVLIYCIVATVYYFTKSLILFFYYKNEYYLSLQDYIEKDENELEELDEIDD